VVTGFGGEVRHAQMELVMRSLLLVAKKPVIESDTSIFAFYEVQNFINYAKQFKDWLL
jgi:hypothetical protein